MNFVKTAVILGVVEMVRDFQFPSAELTNTNRVQRTSHRNELSRQGRSLHQDLFLSREPRSEDDPEAEEVLMSTPPPSFSRILEHSWEPDFGEGSICNTRFAPSICVCSSGLVTSYLLPEWFRFWTDFFQAEEVSCTCPSNLRRLILDLNQVSSFAVIFFIFLEFLFPRRVSHQASDTSPFPIVLLLNWDQYSCSAAAVVWWWTSWRPWSFKTLASSSYRAKHSISLLRPLWSCEMLQVSFFVRQLLCDYHICHICFRHPDWSGQLWHKPPKPCHRGLILSWSETFQFRLHILPPSPCPP